MCLCKVSMFLLLQLEAVLLARVRFKILQRFFSLGSHFFRSLCLLFSTERGNKYICLLVNFKASKIVYENLQFLLKPQGVLDVVLLRTVCVVGYTPPVYTFPVACWISSSIPFSPRTRGTNARFLKRDVNLSLKESEELYKHADKWYGKCVHEFGLSFLSSGICHVPFNWFVLMYHPSSVITMQYSCTVP